MRHGLMDQVINDLKAAVWTVIVTKRTRSLSYYRLFRLSKRTPRITLKTRGQYTGGTK